MSTGTGSNRDDDGRNGSDRRTFLKQSAAALSAVSLSSCAPETDGDAGPDSGGRQLDPVALRSVGEVVLPDELGVEGRERAVATFEGWLAALEPAAELNHGYGTAEIGYGPPDPAPAWAAQLQALDIEAGRRHESPFAELSVDGRRALIVRQLADAGESLPAPAQATHVALGLLSHFLRSPEATDLCYGVAIGRQTCRGIASASEPPAPIQTAYHRDEDRADVRVPGPTPREPRTPLPSPADHAVGLGD